MSLRWRPAGRPFVLDPKPWDFAALQDDWRVAIAATAGLWLVFAWPWVFGGQVIPWDAKDFYYPAFRALAVSLAAGESGFWNPWLRAGSAAVTDPQSWIFTPTMRLAAYLNPAPSMRFLDVLQLLHLLAGGLGVLALGRVFRQKPVAALVAAIVFMFGGAVAARLQHSMMIVSYAFLPWCLLLLRASMLGGTLRSRLLSAVGLGFIAAAMAVNRDQVAFLNVLCLGLACLWWTGLVSRNAGGKAAALRLAGLLPAALVAGAILLVPALLTLDALASSTRSVLDFEVTARASLQPAALLSTLMPSFFGGLDGVSAYWGPGMGGWLDFSEVGIINDGTTSYLYCGVASVAVLAFVFASQGLRRGLLSREESGLILLGLAFAVIYGVGGFTPLFGWLYDWVPGVRLYRRPNDAVFLINAMAALLVGAAVQVLLTAPAGQGRLTRRGMAALAASGAAVVGTGLWLAVRFDQLALVLPQLALAAIAVMLAILFLGRLTAAGRPVALGVLLVLVLAGDLIARNSASVLNARPESGIAAYRPEGEKLAAEIVKNLDGEDQFRAEIYGIDRAPGFDGGGSWQNAALVYGIEQTLGYDPLLKADYASAVGAEQNSNSPGRRFTKLFTGYNSPLARLLGIRLVVTGRPIDAICSPAARGNLKFLGEHNGAFVYLNPNALPRVMAVGRAEPDGQGALSEHPRQTVLIEGLEAPEGEVEASPPGKAKITRRGGDHLEISAKFDRPGWLVLNERYHPAWRATLDGLEVQVFRANRLFRALRLPAGKHKIVFDFDPLRPSELWRIARKRLGLGV